MYTKHGGVRGWVDALTMPSIWSGNLFEKVRRTSPLRRRNDFPRHAICGKCARVHCAALCKFSSDFSCLFPFSLVVVDTYVRTYVPVEWAQSRDGRAYESLSRTLGIECTLVGSRAQNENNNNKKKKHVYVRQTTTKILYNTFGVDRSTAPRI